MTPLRLSRGGGAQLRFIEFGVVAIIVNSVGAAVGTEI